MKKILSNILIRKEQSKDKGLFSFKTLSEKFFWALKWNGIESIIYHMIFMLHQWYMFSCVDTELYGIMGTFFACSYFGVTFLLGALDTSLMPWISFFTQDKKSFLICIKKYITPQIIVYLSTPLLIFILGTLFPYPIFSFLKNHFLLKIWWH